MATALLCSATRSNKRHDSVAQKDPLVARTKLSLNLNAASLASNTAEVDSKSLASRESASRASALQESASRAFASRHSLRRAFRHALRLKAEDYYAKVNKEIEKDRTALRKSIETKERSDANAIQGIKEADELSQAKAGNFGAFSGSANIQRKYIHEQHWFIPGNKTAADQPVSTITKKGKMKEKF